MSLPVVSYGKYNYGQYSNPTPIRFTGGFGAGIAQGLTKAFIRSVEEKKQQEKKEDAANLASAKAQIQFQAATDAYLKSATEENKSFLIEQKQFRGETERLFALKQIGLDEYTKRVSASQGLLSQLKQLNGLVTELGKVNNGQEILDSELRNNPQAFDANIKLEALTSGKFKIKGNYEDGFDIELPMYQSAMGTGAELKEFAVGDIPLNQLLQNPKLYTPGIKYEHGANKNMKQLAGVIENLAQKKGLTTQVDDGDYENLIIDPNKTQDLIKLIKQDGTFIAALTKQNREQLFEDNMFKLDSKGVPTQELNGVGSFKNSAEQNKLIDDKIINDIVEAVQGNIVSRRKKSSSSDSSSTDDNITAAIKNINTINKSLQDTAGSGSINPEVLAQQYNDFILGQNASIMKPPKSNEYFLISRRESDGGQGFKQKVDINNLEAIKNQVITFLYGQRAQKYITPQLPVNEITSEEDNELLKAIEDNRKISNIRETMQKRRGRKPANQEFAAPK